MPASPTTHTPTPLLRWKRITGMVTSTAAVGMAACSIVTPSASAMTATLSGGSLRLVAGAGEVVDLTGRPGDPGLYEISPGPGVSLTAPGGCTIDLGSLVCPVASFSQIDLTLGSGDDRVSLRGGPSLRADGGAGDDVLRGTDAADRLRGGAGDDELDGRDGADDLDGGDGADDLRGADGADVLAGGAGADLLDGGLGNDQIAAGDDSDTVLGDAGGDVIDAGKGDDLVDAGDGDDQLSGGDGVDQLLGGPGDDAINGGAGPDQLDGAAGADTISAGDGDDTATGGTGADFLSGGLGADVLEGGDGADVVAGDDGNDELRGDIGDDTLNGADGADRLDGGEGRDAVSGGDGDDRFAQVGDGERVRGQDGTDTLDYAGAPSGVVADLDAATVATLDTADLLLDRPEVVRGTDHADVLRAGAGSVALYGEGGDDTFVSGPAADRLDGGDGRDTADFSARVAPLVLRASGEPVSGEAGEHDTITDAVEILVGGSGNDQLFGSSGAGELRGGAGDDLLEDLLDGEYDIVHCGDGSDTVAADRMDAVQPDCERWNDGVILVRSIDPITTAVRSTRLSINRGGRMRLSLVCSREAVEDCRAQVTVELRHARKWRRGVTRSLLLTPGRRRSVAVFAQRGFLRLLDETGRRPKARVTVSVRDGIGRTATTVRELPLTLPTTFGADR